MGIKSIETQTPEQLIDIIQTQEREIEWLKQQLRLMMNQQFGRKKETAPQPGQTSLFEDWQEALDSLELEEEIVQEVKAHKRKAKKNKGIKRTILDQFPAEEKLHELSNCQCPDCGESMKQIGASAVREELVFIPAHMKRIIHKQASYKCEGCTQKEGANDKIVKAPVPKAPLHNSLGSASLIAQTIHQKYGLKLPAYRQEQEWKQMNLPLSRDTICGWHIRTYQYYFKDLCDLLLNKLRQQEVLHADETSYRVLESQKAKNYFWLLMSGKDTPEQGVIYQFDEGRGRQVILDLLGPDFEGSLHADMYGAYVNLCKEKVKVSGCWAHLRRKFFEALPAKVSMHHPAYQAVKWCDSFFQFEQNWKELTAEERLTWRQTCLQRQVNEFFDWVKTLNALPQTKLGMAISYALKHEPFFRQFLEDGRLEMSNNRAERQIKPLVIGRKNWLFSQSIQGAQAAGGILSLYESAKLNGIHPPSYFQYLLEELPELPVQNFEALEAYLPWSSKVKEACQAMK